MEQFRWAIPTALVRGETRGSSWIPAIFHVSMSPPPSTAPTHKCPDPEACPDPTPASPWRSDHPRGSLCAVCPRNAVPTRHPQLRVMQRPPPPQPTLCRAAAPPGLLRPHGRDRLTKPGRARLGGARVGASGTPQHLPRGLHDHKQSRAPGEHRHGGHTVSLHLPSRFPVSAAWSSPAKVQGGAGPGDHEGLQGCFRPSRVPSGVSTVHRTPSTSSLPHGSYISMFTASARLSASVRVWAHVSTPERASLAFLLVLHPQHQLPEEGAEGPGPRKGTSSGRWWPWGGAQPARPRPPMKHACSRENGLSGGR